MSAERARTASAAPPAPPPRTPSEDDATHALELLDTAVAIAAPSGAILYANPAFHRWTRGRAATLDDALDAEVAPIVAGLARGARAVTPARAASERGREIPVEYGLRWIEHAGAPALLVEGRDVSRVHEKDAMLRTYSRAMDDHHRLLRAQQAENASLLESTQRMAAAQRLLLDSMEQGFAALDGGGALLPARSAAFDRWFSESRDGASFAACLAPISEEAAARFELAWSQLALDDTPIDFVIAQLPTRLHTAARHLRIDYKAEQAASGALTRVLVVVTDITSEVEREAGEAYQRDLLRLMAHYVHDRRGFSRLLEEIDGLIADAVAPEARTDPALLRTIHTLKGTCALAGAESVASCCHDVEDMAAQSGSPPPPRALRAIEAAWRQLRDSFGWIDERDHHVVAVDRGELELLRSHATELAPSDLAATLERWLWEPADLRLQRLGEHVASLARRLGKGAVELVIDGGGLAFEPARWAPLWSSFVHLIRNVADHGLEPPAARAAAGKAPLGRVALRAQLEDRGVVIELEDDGAGVDWPAIERRARARGIPAESHEELTAALFADGVTSRTEATEHSGRGVGLAAVRAAVEQLGGAIRVASERGRGTRFELVLPPRGVSIARLPPRAPRTPTRAIRRE